MSLSCLIFAPPPFSTAMPRALSFHWSHQGNAWFKAVAARRKRGDRCRDLEAQERKALLT